MRLKPAAMKGFGVFFLVFGALLFFGGYKSAEEGDRQTEGRLQAYAALFAICGATLLAIGISRTRSQAPSEVSAYPSSSQADVSELAVRIAKEQPDLYKCFSNDAVFQGVIGHVASGNPIKAIQLIQEKSDLNIRDAKVLTDKVKVAIAGSRASA